MRPKVRSTLSVGLFLEILIVRCCCFLHVTGGLNDIKRLDSYNDLLITLILNTND